MISEEELEKLEYRVPLHKRCKNKNILKNRRCTRKRGHNGKHICQMTDGEIIGEWGEEK